MHLCTLIKDLVFSGLVASCKEKMWLFREFSSFFFFFFLPFKWWITKPEHFILWKYKNKQEWGQIWVCPLKQHSWSPVYVWPFPSNAALNFKSQWLVPQLLYIKSFLLLLSKAAKTHTEIITVKSWTKWNFVNKNKEACINLN